MANNGNSRLTAHVRMLASVKSDYYGHVFESITGAYSDAFDSFNAKLAEQKAADDLKMELGLTILIVAAVAAAPIAAGTAVTALAGTAVGKTVATYTTRVASSSAGTWAQSQGGALSSAATHLSNRTIVKAIWAPVRREVTTFVRKSTAKEARTFAVGISPLEMSTGNPSSLMNAISGYVKDSYGHLENCIEAMIASDAPEALRVAFADDLDRHPFLKRPATIDEATLATMRRRFELVLFLDLLMGQDRLEVTRFTGKYTHKDGVAIYETKTRGIAAMPGSPGYPKAESRPFSREGQRVTHRDPGGEIEDRINALMAAEVRASDTLLKGMSRTIIRDRSFLVTGPFGDDLDAPAMAAGARALRKLADASPLVTLIPSDALPK